MISWLKRKIFPSRPCRKNDRTVSQFIDTGFHGDEYLLQLANYLAANCTVFVETGANVGSTLAYVARTHPQLRCLSCEPDPAAFAEANANAGKLQNVALYRGTSQEFIRHLTENESSIFFEQCLFWLDAHGYGFEWPLEEELEFITQRFKSGYILIDDFKVPGREQFGYDIYQHQICSYDYVKGSLNPNRTYQIYYPVYEDKTSKHHPLRGWGLLVFGRDDFHIPDQLADKMAESKSQGHDGAEKNI
jgi:hypothetical protein